MLEQYAGKDEAGALAPHATGGMYELVEAKKDRHPVLAFAIDWDTPDAALKFLADYRKVLTGKSKKCEFDPDSGNSLSGTNDHGRFEVRAAGSRFESLEGLPPQVH